MSSGVLFRDRAEAGQQLASVIAAEFPPHTEQALPIVYALPRGGFADCRADCSTVTLSVKRDRGKKKLRDPKTQN